jgi:hypothetical protein
MKNTLFATALLAVAGVAFAQTPQNDPSTSSLRDSKSPKIRAEIVSVDPTGKTITVQKAVPAETKAGESKPRTSGTDTTGAMDRAMVLKVEDAVAGTLSNYKAGDKVVLTCKSDMGAGSMGTNPNTPGSVSGSTGSPGSSAGTTGSTGSTGNTGSTGMTGGSGTRSGGFVHCDTVTAITKS